jgi:RNase P/RNase MRP subunit POP5
LRICYFTALVVAFTVLAPRVAVAQQGKSLPVFVLAIDSDDADEQADALTTALRAHVRTTPGWSLRDATQSLGMLTAAFRCPQKPDATCLERIADKLKADQFLWGVMSKAPGQKVSAELHLWARGKPDKVAHQIYSDNMKEASDDSLRRVATQMFTELVGAPSTGAGASLAIHTNSDTGTVVVDGTQRVAIDHGRATLSLAPGAHSIEIQASGFATTHKDITVDAATNSQLEVQLAPAAPAAGPEEPSKPLPIRAIAGWTSVGAGGVLVIVGAAYAATWFGDISDLNNARANNYLTGSKTPVTDPCSSTYNTPATQNGCNAVNSAHSAVVGEVVSFSLGAVLAGVGIYLLATDHPEASARSTPDPTKTGLASLRLSPSVAPGQGSMLVLGQF